MATGFVENHPRAGPDNGSRGEERLMRVERLTSENPRTQGAARRALYRRHSPAHLDTIAALLRRGLATTRTTARATPAPRAAVILGAGACTEVPLEPLARALDAILLVDLDAPGMQRARAELPASLRSRVRTLPADLSGGVSQSLAALLRAQPWDDLARLGGPTGAAPLDAAAACLAQCPVPDPPTIPGLTPGAYGLVISSLLLTQLFSLPLLDVLDTLALHAPDVVDRRETHPRYRAAVQDFRRRVAHAHLSLLDALLAPGGAGVLITDVTGHLLPARSGPHTSSTPESLPVLPPDVLDLPRDLAARFTLTSPTPTWRWIVEPSRGETPGRAYDVFGAVFTKPGPSSAS
jgi:hypothetical protein